MGAGLRRGAGQADWQGSCCQRWVWGPWTGPGGWGGLDATEESRCQMGTTRRRTGKGVGGKVELGFGWSWLQDGENEVVRGNDGLAETRVSIRRRLEGHSRHMEQHVQSSGGKRAGAAEAPHQGQCPGAGRARNSGGREAGARSRPAIVTLHAGSLCTKCALSLQQPPSPGRAPRGSHIPVAEAPTWGVDRATTRVNCPSAPQPTCATTTSFSARTAAPACRTSAAPARAATPACTASNPAATPPTTAAAWTATARRGPRRTPPPCSAACCCWGWPPA